MKSACRLRHTEIMKRIKEDEGRSRRMRRIKTPEDGLGRYLQGTGTCGNSPKESVVALIDKGAKCAICGQEIDLAGPIVATTHFIGDFNDPLWRFSDAAMHYDCFQRWPHREEFVNKYNSTLGQLVWGNGTRHLMHPDGRIESVRAD